MTEQSGQVQISAQNPANEQPGNAQMQPESLQRRKSDELWKQKPYDDYYDRAITRVLEPHFGHPKPGTTHHPHVYPARPPGCPPGSPPVGYPRSASTGALDQMQQSQQSQQQQQQQQQEHHGFVDRIAEVLHLRRRRNSESDTSAHN